MSPTPATYPKGDPAVRHLLRCVPIVALLGIFAFSNAAQGEPKPTLVDRFAAATGCPGGLVVAVKAADPGLIAELAASGRYLIQVVDDGATAVAALQGEWHRSGIYGLASAEKLASFDRLPLSENIVNILMLGPGARVSEQESLRVVCPGGVVARVDETGEVLGALRWKIDRKPRPATMDEWTHARHGPGANPVSLDRAVSPPRRVRWVTGPQQEISNMVTAGGRNFYAGVIARDAFNGLKLWEANLKPSPARGGYGFGRVTGSVQPVATPDRLYVFDDGVVRALCARTGEALQEYPAAGKPVGMSVVTMPDDARRLVAVDKTGISLVDLTTGELVWRRDAADPRYVVADVHRVTFIEGAADAARLQCILMVDARPVWQQENLAWMPKVRNLVAHGDLLVCEISTQNDDKPGNVIHVLEAASGAPLWSREFVPGMTHMKQARAMFVGDLLWTLEEGSSVGLDPRSGEVKHKFRAGTGHCFPPVATARYMFAGELDMTDLADGSYHANRITKGACSRDAGWIPANGLIYTAPKHCICWPMLRDFSALAGERPEGPAIPSMESLTFEPEKGPGAPPAAASPAPDGRDWPCYRHDAWRSAGTAARISPQLKVLWTKPFGDRASGRVADDWQGNFFIRGPLGPPVVADGRVFVTRPDAHEVVAIDAQSGDVVWRYTANGRVDTAPTIDAGRCLFGCKSGWVYALNAATGELLWRLRAAPVDERIVAYGQLESPWPVPGSVLVVDGVAYFAAGRQSLADGGILVFAVDPATGKPHWVRQLDSVPQTKFYDSSGLEFDNFDLLHREGDRVAMSRWYFDLKSGETTCEARSGFARIGTVGGTVLVPRGTWSYAPRNETEQWKERPYVRPLAVFRGNALYTCSQDRRTLFRRDFDANASEELDVEWFKGWETYARARKGGELWQSQRLAKEVRWSAVPLEAWENGPIDAMVLTSEALFVASPAGRLAAVSLADGKLLGDVAIGPIAWDSLAAAGERLYFTTRDGQVVCLGAK
jgi:outer membrane protein assembly factor BamB